MSDGYPEEFNDKTQVLAIQILVAGLVVSAVFFAIIVIVFTIPGVVQHPESGEGGINFTILTAITLFATITAVPVSNMLFVNNLKQLKDTPMPLVQLRTAYVVRFALLEGVALLGLVFILLAAVGDQVQENMMIWLNAVPFIWMLIVFATNFPSLERLKSLYKEYTAF
ncbi:MAG: hypothetical protein LAT84_00760 [Balneolia bacterium]|nr:hypothetical protein [Balneolia bacterium]